jgi:hypothetical protein
MVTEGKQNPTGTINRSAALYIGHDAKTIIDELSISNIARDLEANWWLQWWFWATIATGIIVAIAAGTLFYFKRKQ